MPLGILTAAAVVTGQPLAGAALFVVSVVSDLADGVLARRWRVTSSLGGLLDHGCDALFVTLVLAAFAAVGAVTWWLPPLIAVAFAQYALDSGAQHGRQLRASQLGRWNGIAYFVLAGALLGAQLLWPALQTALAVAAWVLAASTLASMLDRLLAARRPSA